MTARALAALVMLAQSASADIVPPLSQVDWTGGVGGISAIDLDADGRSFVALGDRGWLIRGVITRDAGGAIAQIAQTATIRLGRIDSEGISWRAAGGVWISTENPDEIHAYTLDGRRITQVPAPDLDLRHNRGFEALAGDAPLYVLAETSGQADVWMQSGTKWRKHAQIALTPGLAPVGADLGPDGRLYILARGVHPGGFHSQVLRIDADGSAQNLMTFPARRHGNLEGISIWRDAQGLVATMVTDNNQLFFQNSAVVEYRLPD